MFIKITLICLTIIGLVSDISFARKKEIALFRIPQNVRDAIHTRLKGTKLIEAKIITKAKKKFYEIKGILKGEPYEFRVTPEGEIIKVRCEKKIDLSAVIVIIIITVKKVSEGIELIEAKIITKAGKKIYVIEGKLKEEKYEFQVTPQANIIKSLCEKKIDLSEVPVIIINTVKKKIEGIELTEAKIITKNRKKTYEIEGQFKKKKYEFEITPQGKILE